MKVVYTAPNRSHHYRYALAMHKAGILHAFVSGFSRLSSHARLDEIGSELHRADILQTVYLAALKLRIANKIASNLAYLAKIEQDISCRNYINNADIFLFYNGSGLSTCQYAKKRGVISIVEAVNSHVTYQEESLCEEYRQLNLAWTPFHKREKERRIKEYELADYILLPSEFVKNSFLRLGFPEQKLLKVPYGFNKFSSLAINKPIELDSKDFVVLYVGSISVRKGVRYLIQAFDKFQHPRKKLVIVGPKTEPEGIQDLAVSPQVTFTGVLKGEALHQAYRSATVFCLPSIEEGLALVLGEALSFGLPIIATTNTGASDIITDGQEGFIVPIKDSDSIFAKLQLLADDVDLYHTMKSLAKSKSQQLNGWDESGRLLVSTLVDVSNKK
ncbi:glycosyltransferase family 4 protein [Spirosoma areae]